MRRNKDDHTFFCYYSQPEFISLHHEGVYLASYVDDGWVFVLANKIQGNQHFPWMPVMDLLLIRPWLPDFLSWNACCEMFSFIPCHQAVRHTSHLHKRFSWQPQLSPAPQHQPAALWVSCLGTKFPSSLEISSSQWHHVYSSPAQMIKL